MEFMLSVKQYHESHRNTKLTAYTRPRFAFWKEFAFSIVISFAKRAEPTPVGRNFLSSYSQFGLLISISNDFWIVVEHLTKHKGDENDTENEYRSTNPCSTYSRVAKSSLLVSMMKNIAFEIVTLRDLSSKMYYIVSR